jgi:hypothetical protein
MTYRRDTRNMYESLAGKFEGKGSRGSSRIWKDMDFEGIGFEGLGWINLAQDTGSNYELTVGFHKDAEYSGQLKNLRLM